MKYTIVRTDTADICIRKIVTFIARNFGEDIALKKLDDLEKNIYLLEDNPYLGTIPRYPVLKRQGRLSSVDTRKKLDILQNQRG